MSCISTNTAAITAKSCHFRNRRMGGEPPGRAGPARRATSSPDRPNAWSTGSKVWVIVADGRGSRPMTDRVAAIDVGTNSTRLLVADLPLGGGPLHAVERLNRITRLGK